MDWFIIEKKKSKRRRDKDKGKKERMIKEALMGSLGLMNGAGVGGVYSAKMRVTERKREERKKKRNKRKEIDPIFHQAKRVENFNLDSRF